jgi:hypothetical protein
MIKQVSVKQKVVKKAIAGDETVKTEISNFKF